MMSICIKLRQCEHCGHRYPYNPSTGDFGRICPKCQQFQSELVQLPSEGTKGGRKEKKSKDRPL